MDTANNLLGGGSSDSEKYNKDTYIGFLKMKKFLLLEIKY